MLRYSLPLISILAVAAVATPSKADPRYQAASNLGGGFIEFLVTGNSAGGRRVVTPQAAPQYAPQAAPQYAPGRPAPGFAVANPGYSSALPEDPYQQGAPARGPQRNLAPMPETSGFDPRFERQEVSYPGPHRAGTIVIDTPNKFLYLVQGNGRALRYGIGVGRPGFEWAGVKSVTRKAEWPAWTPPPEMLKRRPDLPRHMVGGPDNPLGARALYLGSSLYRIHGTNEPSTIGQAVSSGCIRLRNEDVTDLYERVKVGAKVVVM